MTSTLTPLTTPETSAPAPEKPQPTPSRPPGGRIGAVVAGLLVLVAVVALVVLIADSGDDADPTPTPPSASTAPVDAAPDSFFGGPEVSYGSVDAMERGLAGDAAATAAPTGSPDAIERWTNDAPEVEHPTTVRPF